MIWCVGIAQMSKLIEYSTQEQEVPRSDFSDGGGSWFDGCTDR